MSSPLSRYAHWLHLGWPAGKVEKLPVVGADGRTNLPGVFLCGDLTGVPLLKFALDSGVRAVRAIAARRGAGSGGDTSDVAILGAGVAALAAALEARQLGPTFVLLEAAEPFSPLVNSPTGKPIVTYPRDMTP